MSPTVACVLRSGGAYEPWHVQALAANVAEHLSGHRFVCLTDMDVPGIETRPLRHGWPGWWSKIELFDDGLLPGRVLYFDLDTVIVGDLSDLASYDGPFAMMNDLALPEAGRGSQRFGTSGVMAWRASPALRQDITETFARMADSVMAHWPGAGDQRWIADSVSRWDNLRELFPGQIVSWKLHCQGGEPDGARVICWHGSIKPWHVGWREAA